MIPVINDNNEISQQSELLETGKNPANGIVYSDIGRKDISHPSELDIFCDTNTSIPEFCKSPLSMHPEEVSTVPAMKNTQLSKKAREKPVEISDSTPPCLRVSFTNCNTDPPIDQAPISIAPSTYLSQVLLNEEKNTPMFSESLRTSTSEKMENQEDHKSQICSTFPKSVPSEHNPIVDVSGGLSPVICILSNTSDENIPLKEPKLLQTNPSESFHSLPNLLNQSNNKLPTLIPQSITYETLISLSLAKSDDKFGNKLNSTNTHPAALNLLLPSNTGSLLRPVHSTHFSSGPSIDSNNSSILPRSMINLLKNLQSDQPNMFHTVLPKRNRSLPTGSALEPQQANHIHSPILESSLTSTTSTNRRHAKNEPQSDDGISPIRIGASPGTSQSIATKIIQKSLSISTTPCEGCEKKLEPSNSLPAHSEHGFKYRLCCKMPPFLKTGFSSILAKIIHIANTPNSKFWKILDVVRRLLDIIFLFYGPIYAAFICDIPGFVIPYLLSIDCILVFCVGLDALRPRYDEYGMLSTNWTGRRKLYWSHRRNRLKWISCLPIDWILYVYYGLYTGNSLMCHNNIWVYQYSDGSNGLAETVPLPLRVTRVFERHMYFAKDIPLIPVICALLRLIRLLHSIDTLSWLRDVRIPFLVGPIGRLCKNLLGAIYMSHWNACVFWFLETRLDPNKRFISRYLVDSNMVPTYVFTRIIFNYVDGQKALFFMLRDVVLVEEAAYQAIEMLLAAIVYGSIFGNLVSTIRSLDDQAAFEKTIKNRNFKKAYLRQYLIKHEFPPLLQQKILDQEEFDFFHKKGMDMDEITNSLPKTLRQEMLSHLYWDLINKVPLFNKTDTAFKIALIEKITTITVPAGFYIFAAGDAGTELYMIKKGAIKILPPDESRILVILSTGQYFGEIALMEDCKRTATACTAQETNLCVLSKPDFNAIRLEFPAAAEIIAQNAKEKKEADARRVAQDLENKLKKEQEAAAAKLREAAKSAKKVARGITTPTRSKGSHLFSSNGMGQTESSSRFGLPTLSALPGLGTLRHLKNSFEHKSANDKSKSIMSSFLSLVQNGLNTSVSHSHTKISPTTAADDPLNPAENDLEKSQGSLKQHQIVLHSIRDTAILEESRFLDEQQQITHPEEK